MGDSFVDIQPILSIAWISFFAYYTIRTITNILIITPTDKKSEARRRERMTCIQGPLTTSQTTKSTQALIPTIEDSQVVFDSERFPSQLVTEFVAEFVPSSQSPNPQSHQQSRSDLQSPEQEQLVDAIIPILPLAQEVGKIKTDTQQQAQQRQEPLEHVERKIFDKVDVTTSLKQDSSSLLSSPERSNSSSPERSNSGQSSDQFSSSSNTGYSSSRRASKEDSQLSYGTHPSENYASPSEGNLDTDEDTEGNSNAKSVENLPSNTIKHQENFDNSRLLNHDTSTASSSTAHPSKLPQQPQQLRSRTERLALAREEQREQLAKERRQRERQCAFPSTNTIDFSEQERNAMGSFSNRPYVDQQHTHQRQLKMYPREQHPHHRPGHVLKRSNATRSNAPPPPQPEEIINLSNRPTHASSSSQSLSQQQQHPPFIPKNRDAYLTRNSTASNATTTTEGPLYYDRLVTEEVLELKEYARLVQTQTAELASRHAIQADLEARLEIQTAQRIQLEASLERQEKRWAEKIRLLEDERDKLKEEKKKEEMTNNRLKMYVVRKDQEIQRMIQRKYESKQRPAPRAPTSVSNQSRINTLTVSHDMPLQQQQQQYNTMVAGDPFPLLRSPHEILEANASMQAGRETNATHNLLDFFGL